MNEQVAEPFRTILNDFYEEADEKEIMEGKGVDSDSRSVTAE